MEKSYSAYREKISAVTKETMKVFPLSEKVLVMLCSYVRQELSRSPRSFLSTSEISVPGKDFSTYMNKMYLFILNLLQWLFSSLYDHCCKSDTPICGFWAINYISAYKSAEICAALETQKIKHFSRALFNCLIV